VGLLDRADAQVYLMIILKKQPRTYTEGAVVEPGDARIEQEVDFEVDWHTSSCCFECFQDYECIRDSTQLQLTGMIVGCMMGAV
jgi:hypothetical protein